MLLKSSALNFSDLPQFYAGNYGFYQDRLNMFIALFQVIYFSSRLLESLGANGLQRQEVMRLVVASAVKRNAHGKMLFSLLEIANSTNALFDLADAIKDIAPTLLLASRAGQEICGETKKEFSYATQEDRNDERRRAILDVSRAVFKDASISDALHLSAKWHSTQCAKQLELIQDFEGENWENA